MSAPKITWVHAAAGEGSRPGALAAVRIGRVEAPKGPPRRLLDQGAPAPDAPRPASGLSREELRDLPLLAEGIQASISDASILEEPGDASQKLFIPRYLVATEVVSGRQQHRARIEQRGAEWVFSVDLQAVPAPEVEGPARAARPLNHGSYPVLLRYAVPGDHGGPNGGATTARMRVFQRVTETDGGLSAALTVAGVSDQGELYDALAQGAEIEVIRALDVASPMEVPNPEAEALLRELEILRRARPVFLRKSGESQGSYLTVLGDHAQPYPVGAPDDRCGFLLLHLGGREALASGDKIALATIDGRLLEVIHGRLSALPPEPGAPIGFIPTRPTCELLIRRVEGATGPGDPVLYMEGEIRVGMFFSLNFFRAETDMSQNGRPWVLETPPPESGLHAGKLRLIADKERQIAAVKKRFAADRFRVDAVALPGHARIHCPPRLHPYLFAGVTPPEGGIVQQLIEQRTRGGAPYFQDAARPERFYYLPDRYGFDSSTGRPSVSVRETHDAGVFRVEYTGVPLVDEGRLERDGGGELLALANARRARDQPLERVELEPLPGDRATFSLVLPRAGDHGRGQPVEQPAPRDAHGRFSGSFAVDAAELQLLFESLFASDGELFRGAVDIEIGAWRKIALPFAGRVPPAPSGVSPADWKREIWRWIFSPEVSSSFRREVTVRIDAGLVEDGRIVHVDFRRGDVVCLDRGRLSGKATLAQPIEDYVLGEPDQGGFAYQIFVESRGGARAAGPWQEGRGASLSIVHLP